MWRGFCPLLLAKIGNKAELTAISSGHIDLLFNINFIVAPNDFIKRHINAQFEKEIR